MRRVVGGVAWLLVGVGVGLLIVGSSLAYPYVHSRIAGPPPANAPPTVSERAESVAPADDPPAVAGRTPTATRLPTRTPGASSLPNPTTAPTVPLTVTAEVAESPTQERSAAPPTRIVVPAIGVDAPVVPVSWYEKEFEGTTQAVWDVPDWYAAGWHETSAPVGEQGNTVLSGHNTANGEVFRDLYRLGVSDEIVLYSAEISRTYHISETLVLPEAGQPLEVRLANARYAAPTENERLTLITCHPYGSLRNRLIVIARPKDAHLGVPEAEELRLPE